jgi:hypothetical protein
MEEAQSGVFHDLRCLLHSLSKASRNASVLRSRGGRSSNPTDRVGTAERTDESDRDPSVAASDRSPTPKADADFTWGIEQPNKVAGSLPASGMHVTFLHARPAAFVDYSSLSPRMSACIVCVCGRVCSLCFPPFHFFRSSFIHGT